MSILGAERVACHIGVLSGIREINRLVRLSQNGGVREFFNWRVTDASDRAHVFLISGFQIDRFSLSELQCMAPNSKRHAAGLKGLYKKVGVEFTFEPDNKVIKVSQDGARESVRLCTHYPDSNSGQVYPSGYLSRAHRSLLAALMILDEKQLKDATQWGLAVVEANSGQWGDNQSAQFVHALALPGAFLVQNGLRASSAVDGRCLYVMGSGDRDQLATSQNIFVRAVGISLKAPNLTVERVPLSMVV